MQKYPNDIMSDHGLHVEIIILSDGHYESEKKEKKIGEVLFWGVKIGYRSFFWM